jgi:hypothetical protein
VWQCTHVHDGGRRSLAVSEVDSELGLVMEEGWFGICCALEEVLCA